MDNSNFDFEEWAQQRRLPPGLYLENSRSLWPFFRRNILRPIKRYGVNGFLWCLGEYQKGIEDARDVQLNEILLPMPGLDPNLDGLTILQISDLHLGVLDGIENAVTDAVQDLAPDLCVLTGDYAPRYGQRTDDTIAGVERIVSAFQAKLGVFAVLGNYDNATLAQSLAGSDFCRLLINDRVQINANGSPIGITGTDDPYDQDLGPIRKALSHTGGGALEIALVHTPDMAAEAASAGFDLYLCGHTHGGQICLPGGKPIITNCRRRPDLASGLWREGSMWGYTSRGAGVSSIPRRHNCPPEVTLIRLIAGHPGSA